MATTNDDTRHVDHDLADCLQGAADEIRAGLYDDSVGLDTYLASLARIREQRSAATAGQQGRQETA